MTRTLIEDMPTLVALMIAAMTDHQENISSHLAAFTRILTEREAYIRTLEEKIRMYGQRHSEPAWFPCFTCGLKDCQCPSIL